MNINVEKIKFDLRKYNSLLEKFEECHINFYNKINSLTSLWSDGNSSLFYDSVNVEKNDVSGVISDLKRISDVYSYIVDSYDKFGKKISYDLSIKNSVIDTFNVYLNKLDQIINSYSSLDLSFCPNEAGLLISQKQKFINVRKSIVDYMNDIINLFDEIELIENQVRVSISHIDINLIKETDISQFI